MFWIIIMKVEIIATIQQQLFILMIIIYKKKINLGAHVCVY